MSTAQRQRSPDPDPDETCDIRDLIDEVIPHPRAWVDTPHELLGGSRPNDLIGTDGEIHVRQLTRSIKHGMPT